MTPLLNAIGERVFARVSVDHFRAGERVLGFVHQRYVLDVAGECIGASSSGPWSRSIVLVAVFVGELTQRPLASQSVNLLPTPSGVAPAMALRFIHRRSLRARASSSRSR